MQHFDKISELAIERQGGRDMFERMLAEMRPLAPQDVATISDDRILAASASVKGYPRSSAFAMGMFGRRGLAQSAARELSPQGIHVVHFVIDDGVSSATRPVPSDQPDSMLDPDAIAQSYLHVLRQPRSAWTWEMELRPWVENF